MVILYFGRVSKIFPHEKEANSKSKTNEDLAKHKIECYLL